MATKNLKTGVQLTLLELLLIPSILKKDGNDYKSLIVIEDITSKVTLTQEQLEKYGINVNASGNIEWNKKGMDARFNIEFTVLEETEIRLALKKLDEDKKLSLDHISLYEKFVK